MAGAIDPPLDFSFYDISTLKKLRKKKPRRGTKTYHRTDTGHFRSRALRLNNNNLESIGGLYSISCQIISHPEKLAWLDLSFNQLNMVPYDFCNFTGLKILYLHGNNICSFNALRVLTLLPKLYSLTLHGNPIEENGAYRKRIVTYFPFLRILDFSIVTSSDREDAERMFRKKRHMTL